MFPIDEEKVKLILKICNLYYFEELTQQEISKRLGISRPHVSRLLKLAREVGIVNISLKDPYSQEQKFEKKLVDHFKIVDAVVVDTYDLATSNSMDLLTNGVTSLLKRLVHNGDTLGVSAGYTLNAISEKIGAIDCKNLTIVPLVGGLGPEGAKWQANTIARNFADRLDCNYFQLNAPSFVSSKAAYDVFTAEPEIKNVCDMALNASIALIGLGTFNENATIIRTGLLSEKDIRELNSKGAVVSICNSFLDVHGNDVDFSGYERMIGINIAQLQRIPRKIGVAIGSEKIPAIISALNGGWIDYLVTSLATVREILQQTNLPEH